MARSMHSSKCKLAILLNIASCVQFNFPWLPCFSGLPSCGSNPSLSSKQGHNTIGIARVVKHFIIVVLEKFIDPYGTFLGILVSFVQFHIAELEFHRSLNDRNVEGLFDIISIHVIYKGEPNHLFFFITYLSSKCLR